MKIKPKEPPVPRAFHDTIRQMIMDELQQGPCSSKDLSSAAHLSEREVFGHLEHIRKSITSTGRHLLITPAVCKKCGFVFSKRERLKKPGKCPVCKGESIQEPLYALEEQH